MHIDTTVTWPATPDAVLALLTDEQFLRERGAALGGQVQNVTVAGTVTATTLSAPTAGVPSVFARFVGNAVTVTERTTWAPDGAGGSRGTLDARAQVFGREVLVAGERRLVPDGAGTRSTVTANVTVDAPLVGAQAAAAVRELVQVVLRREDELLRGRLG